MTTEIGERWHPGLILAMRSDEIGELYATLAPPALTDLDGDFAGYAHLGRDAAEAATIHGYVHDRATKGHWLGKSFVPLAGRTGEGHNRLLDAEGRTHRRERFHTSIGRSLIDGAPTFVITYAPFCNAPAQAGFIDEIRRLGPDQYLLLATADDGEGGRTLPAAMFLEGPIGPFEEPDSDTEELPVGASATTISAVGSW